MSSKNVNTSHGASLSTKDTENTQRPDKRSEFDIVPVNNTTTKHWKPQEQLQYYYGTIQFFLKNSHLSLSWEEWKPMRFFTFVQGHITAVFGKMIRTNQQVKTKDQNLKKKHFKKASQKMDLIELSYKKLSQFVQHFEKHSHLNKETDKQLKEKLKRFQLLTEKCTSYQESLKKPKQYQRLIKNMIRQAESSRFKRAIQKLQRISMDCDPFQSSMSSQENFEVGKFMKL